MEGHLGTQSRRQKSYERDADADRLVPFSLSHDNRPQPSRIPSSTFSKSQNNRAFTTKSSGLSENALEKSVKRSSLFLLPSSHHGGSNRRRHDDTQKSRPMLGLNAIANINCKTEEKPFTFGQGSQTTPANTHTSIFSQGPPSSPPIDDVPAAPSPNFMNYSRKALSTQDFSSKSRTTQRFSELEQADSFSSEFFV
jgi:hypothetical protein